MINRTNINQEVIIEIEDFLNPQEIEKLLKPRKEKFTQAISHYPEYYRNNDRLVEDDPKLAEQLYSALLKHLPLEQEFQAVGLNERLRYCRYQKGQSFSKHQDGVYYPNEEEESRLTFLLYLNGAEEFRGGGTAFYSSQTNDKAFKTIYPKAGKLVIFDHRLWHKGLEVNKGNKYILRSDILVKSKRQEKQHQGYIWSLLKSQNNQFLSCGRDKSIKLWNSELQLLNSFRIHSKSVLKMAQLNDDKFISCSRDFTIKKWTLQGEVLASCQLGEMILDIKVNPKGQIIAAGTSGKLYLINSKLKVLKTIQLHSSWIWSIALSGDKVISCGEDGAIYQSDFGKNELLHQAKQALFCIRLKNANELYCGSKDGSIIQLNINSQKIRRIKPHDSIVRAILFHQNDIISAGEDNRVMQSNLENGKQSELMKADNFIQDLLIIKDKIYTASYSGEISILEPHQLVAVKFPIRRTQRAAQF